MFDYTLLKVSKRVAIILLIAVFSIGFISCRKIPTQPSESQASEGITDNTGPVTPDPTPDPDNPGQPTQPTQPTFDKSTYRDIQVPWVDGRNNAYSVSYLDTNQLSELWLAQIKREGQEDGRVFAIRNRANDKGMNDFQKVYDGRQDYYYFRDNGDIVYKGGDLNNKKVETLMKTYVGAVMINYRRVVRRERDSDIHADDEIAINQNSYTVGGVYRMAISHDDAQKKFAHMTGPTDGAYEFIAARRRVYTYYTATVQLSYWYKRRFDTSSLEVLVLSEDANEGNTDCMGLHSYYEYYEEPGHIMKFTESVLGTEEASPDNLNRILNRTTTFTDGSRWWSFMVMPGHPN